MTNRNKTKVQRQEEAGIAALFKLLKNHPKHCTYWIFSGDRHCYCGRDIALETLRVLIDRADLNLASHPGSVADKKV